MLIPRACKFSRQPECAYAGYDSVYETGCVREAGCIAHVRKKSCDLVMAHKSPVGTETLKRIAELYVIEKEIRGRLPEKREVHNPRSRHCSAH
jgi:transposase